ncbi:phage integrase SAM-like domain-containing protein [Sulfurimonas sp.]|uniref:phage integrase SAM-like domain-containing protein n=1 Tax=Sulfurimonas sp. TaxID=2022749 RepID=UPI0039E3F630
MKNQESRHGTLYNPRTIKKIITNLRALFNWAIKEGYIDENLMIVKDIIKVDNKR